MEIKTVSRAESIPDPAKGKGHASGDARPVVGLENKKTYYKSRIYKKSCLFGQLFYFFQYLIKQA